MKALAVAVGAFAATGAVLAFAAACRKAGALVDQQWEDGMAELGARDGAPTSSQLDQLWRDLNLSRHERDDDR